MLCVVCCREPVVVARPSQKKVAVAETADFPGPQLGNLGNYQHFHAEPAQAAVKEVERTLCLDTPTTRKFFTRTTTSTTSHDNYKQPRQPRQERPPRQPRQLQTTTTTTTNTTTQTTPATTTCTTTTRSTTTTTSRTIAGTTPTKKRFRVQGSGFRLQGFRLRVF